MDPQIEETVIEILKNSDMDEMTEFKVRKMAGEKLGFDLSGAQNKQFIRTIVESFLLSQQPPQQSQTKQTLQALEEEDEDDDDDDDDDEKPKVSPKEYDDDGDLIICRLSNKRRVTVQDFKGKTLVSIREYYDKDGKQCPSSKGTYYNVNNFYEIRIG
ncbi:hypothetical protein GIB67_001573 [Kingdonia uniflora]|uniref:DEK-C domain-containing protein n=1 Tax=Kingdonia uniflora TaxID=39325 RepID=A0A7J7L0U5_9MAGN|nr:hypothetical protein GIB67_001573 [Kingdonia uniflora]